ncbi:MAG: patatin-like phospholipase family protein [Chitinophagaceae bacterium]|nr:patatin-like phospholipase family protein [Chitinophagaceae bacterium]
MKQTLSNIYYSFPIQLFILHFRKFQVLLIFWYVIGSTINSGFMENYGADALFFSPEYLGNVNALSAAIVGIAMGIFVMGWNITTFILHSKRFRFLATSSQPFLKYCINNALLPLLFLAFYFFKLYEFDRHKELMSIGEVLVIIAGILAGFILILAFSFAYFFGAEKTIQRTIATIIDADQQYNYDPVTHRDVWENPGLKVGHYLGRGFRFRKIRNVSHYNEGFLDTVFKRHHFSGIISIALAFIFLMAVGFFMDSPVFQVPAAASILIFFAVMTAVIGALSYFLQSWSLPAFIIFILVIDVLYKNEIIDSRNKAYGINYIDRSTRPDYNKWALQKLCTPEKIAADKANMLQVLENWKKKQTGEKPVMVFINVSGGGLRSGTFVMNTLQQLDSALNGRLMQHTMLISGASGGMLAATYYRELYREKQKDSSFNMYSKTFSDNMATDLLNPLFSSLVSRDVFAPAQKFSIGEHTYVKDRGYAFEQKLNSNSGYLLSHQLKDYTEAEKSAAIPLMIFNSTITRDGRRMMITSQPVSFMMKPLIAAADQHASPDAVDFTAMFAKQDPFNIRLLSALRMNATFPYILPNVWLPSNPVIDVMDAGLRDNFGQETTLRFIENFKDWLKENTGGIIILQMRDRMMDNWQEPLGTGSVTDLLVKPGTMLQHNWYKLQDYSETDQYSYLQPDFGTALQRISFMYIPKADQKRAALNFHLTAREKRDVKESFNNEYNQASLRKIKALLQ